MSIRDQILAADDLRREPVDVPEWPGVGPLHVRTMTGADREAFEVRAKDDRARTIALLIAYTLCDGDGNLVFTPDDLDAINGKSVAALMRIQAAAFKINRLDGDAVDQAEGESDATPSSSSPSGSPNASA